MLANSLKMVGDPVQPTTPHISCVDGVAGPVTWYGIGDELDLDVVVFEGVVELVGLAYWDAFVAGVGEDEGWGSDLVCVGDG